jgi:cell division protein FtsB
MAKKKTVKKSRAKKQDKGWVNKYTLTTLVFFVWLAFFDKYNFITQFKLANNVEKLENQKADYERMLDEAVVERETINQNIEKYGREKYLFHKENEEIILIK